MYSYIDDEDQMGLDSISHNDSNVNVEDNKKEVQDILKGIAGLKQRLGEIQEKCRHSDTDLKFIKTNDKQELRDIYDGKHRALTCQFSSVQFKLHYRSSA